MINSFLKYPFTTSVKKQYYFLLALAAVFFIPFLGHVHLFDWDEINFAESSREMLISGDWLHVQINYEPFWEKPPLFFWIQSISMAIFGVNEFGARFPNALFGIITILVIYFIGKKHFSAKLGMMWALVYAGSLLPHIYFRSGIIDPIFNLFIFLSVYHLLLNIKNNKSKNALYAGLFSGLAILTKGPVGLLLVLLTYLTWAVVSRFKCLGKPLHIIYYILICAGISLIWILPEISANGFSMLGEFITYQIRLLTTGDAGHEQPFYYHFVVVLIGCFPMSIFALPAFKAKALPDEIGFARWMKILFWVVLILFTIVETKIVHYSSMCWLPLSFLAARQLESFELVEIRKWLKAAYLFFGILISILLIGVPILLIYKENWAHLVKDKFAQASILLPVNWNAWDFLPGIMFFMGIWISFFFLRKIKIAEYLFSQALLLSFVLISATLTIVPKIEQHSQRSAIEFFKSLKNKDVYVFPVGHKSYAHWYYFEVPNTDNDIRKSEETLLYSKLDKPVYFITKINCDFLDNKLDLVEKVGEKGGFKFYKRIK